MKEPTEEDIYRQQQIDLQNEYLEAITDPNKIRNF